MLCNSQNWRIIKRTYEIYHGVEVLWVASQIIQWNRGHTNFLLHLVKKNLIDSSITLIPNIGSYCLRCIFYWHNFNTFLKHVWYEFWIYNHYINTNEIGFFTQTLFYHLATCLPPFLKLFTFNGIRELPVKPYIKDWTAVLRPGWDTNTQGNIQISARISRQKCDLL